MVPAAAWRAGVDDEIMPACRRHLQCPFGMLLTQNLVHIATIVGMTCGRLAVVVSSVTGVSGIV